MFLYQKDRGFDITGFHFSFHDANVEVKPFGVDFEHIDIPNAAIQRGTGRLGVWRVEDDGLQFAPIVLGQTDLDGFVQVREGLSAGDRVVLYSEKTLTEHSRIHVVDHLASTAP